jgi:hypothetical protein
MKEDAYNPDMSLKNSRHEAFAVAVGAGSPIAESYRQHVSEGGRCTDRTAQVEGSKLAALPAVAARIDEIRSQAGELADKVIGFNKEQLITFLVEVIKTPIGQVHANHHLCQEHVTDVLEVGGSRGKLKRGEAEEGNESASAPATVLRVKVKMPGKIDAARLLATVCGWNAPAKVEGNVNVGAVNPTIEAALTELLA